MRLFRILATILVVLLVSRSAQPLAAQPQSNPVEIRISETTGLPDVMAYHGMLLNHQNRVIPATPENIGIIMRAFSSSMLSTAGPSTNQAYLSARLEANSIINDSPGAGPLVDGLLVRTLLPRLSSEQRQFYEARLAPIEQWAGIVAARRSQRWMNRDERRIFSRMSPLSNNLGAQLAPPTATYIEECRSQSVPIPPDWGSSAWRLQGVLDAEYAFAGEPGDVTQVWTYADPAVPGTCIALPRRNQAANGIRLLGIICQSARTGRACFWDNIDRNTGRRPAGADAERFAIADIVDGNIVAENCTGCHRGYNVFLIHPGTALEVSAPFINDPETRYSPISSQPKWGNPPALIEVGSGPCGSCHEVPAVGRNELNPASLSPYCQILQRVVSTTMPRISQPAGWDSPSARYAIHVNLLKEQCRPQ